MWALFTTNNNNNQMKIEYRFGDLLSHPGRYILQGCNAQGKMNKGVAKAIRELYPQVFEQYRARHELAPLQLGEVITVDCGKHLILNGITQDKYSEDGEDVDVVYADYQAIARVVNLCDALLDFDTRSRSLPGLIEMPRPELAMPLIGAGLAHGDWGIISQSIEDNTPFCKPVVYIREQHIYDSVVSQYGN